ncbi:MAG: amino acid ABC transporter permease [Deltaproteobacteria bacterium RIFCSPLOWO2_02_FULL_47_10]|nr:MAG: amino acid ABC transporter permease [Deltaproteobacteria bacterium RIFCSPLOWO2_02_FULL_47_10]
MAWYKKITWWWLLATVIILTVFLTVAKSDPFWRILRFVSDGILVTVMVTTTSFLLVLIAGMFGGMARLSKNKFIYGVSTLYVELVRGIPLLVQLIWWYFAFPIVIQQIGRRFNMPSFVSYQANAYLMAVIGLVFCYGAYMSEIYRAGIQSISKGQMEAARSLGMSYFQAMRYVVLPQAIRVIMPPVGNEFIALLKDSSLVSVVAVADITRRGREYMSTHFNPIEVWTFIALLYLVMTLFSARIVAIIERKLER